MDAVPAHFDLLRGDADDLSGAKLPRPAPRRGDGPTVKYREIPIAIQDRSFNTGGSLFCPDDRAFFAASTRPGRAHRSPPAPMCSPSRSSPHRVRSHGEPPLWNPESFGTTMVVDGRTRPYLQGEQRRYRVRLLNGTRGRFLILRMENDMPLWPVGAEAGLLPDPVRLEELLLAPAERADVALDFSKVPACTRVVLENLGPDEVFGGGAAGEESEASDPGTTGQVLQSRVTARSGADLRSPPAALSLPESTSLPRAEKPRDVSLDEMISMSVKVGEVEENETMRPYRVVR